jgi:hypothetical protein
MAAGPLLPAQENEVPTIRVLEGSGAVVPRSAASPRRFVVAVTDAAGRPAPGLTVTFRLPADGPTGRFASGLRSESMLTDDQGQAFVRGIQWGDRPGKAEIQVIAASAARRGEAVIPVEISATAPAPPKESVRGPSSGKKWLALVAVAGGAVAGLAVARGGKTATAAVVAPPAALVVPPVVGAPTISIGRPQ